MDLETLVYEKEDRIATLTLDRPKSGNALSRRLRDELDRVAYGGEYVVIRCGDR